MKDYISQKKTNNLEEYINNHCSISESYFDKLVKRHPRSDYLVGMKLYTGLSKTNCDSLLSFYQYHKSTTRNFEDGTYTNLGLACLYKMKNSTDSFLKYINISISKDTLCKNKYTRFQLYDFYYYKDYALALKYLNEALTIDPLFSSALIEKAQILRFEVKYQESIKILDEVIKRNNNPYACYFRSLFYISERQFDQAIELLNKANSQIEIPEVYLELGYIAGETGDKASEIENYLKALEIDSNNKHAFERIGYYYIDLNDFENARIYFEKTINTFPENRYSDYLNLIHLNFIQNNFQGSKEMIETYLEKFGNDFNIDSDCIIFDYFIIGYDKAKADFELCKTRYSDEYLEKIRFLIAQYGINFN